MSKSDICKPLEIIPSWPDIFHVSFTKQYVYIEDEWIQQESDRPRIVVGLTKQDKKKEKVFHKENDTNIIIQKENEGFVQYKWKDTDNNVTCERKMVEKLQPFMPDLKYYQLTKTTKAGKQVIRTYYFQNGPVNNWALECYRYWWKVVYDITSGTILPLTYEYRYTDVDMGDSKAFDDFKYKAHETGPLVNTDDWFNIPENCMSLKATED